MLIDKPSYCTHEGPILSVHIQPSGHRFATGGMDQKVKIWSLPVVLDAKRELQERQAHGGADPRPLAVLADHTAPVNVVRFSHGTRSLASGSDDKMICIFEHRAGPGSAVLGMDSPSAENWRTKLVLRGHSNNVVDLGWSADDARLASASVDNTVCVWDALTGSLVRKLDLHTSFVKGVAWDPVGSYLASQSEDKSVVVWRVDDWSVVATVRGPWNQMVSATFANRLSWSPDGQMLLTGNSYQGATHAAVVIPREKWTASKEHLFVSGHKGAVVCASFNPRMFHAPVIRQQGAASSSNGAEQTQLANVFALGSQDKCVSMWKAVKWRPVACGERLFKGQVVDVAWTPDGYGLLACSADGTVAVLQFTEAELGKVASKEEQEEVLQHLYGAGRGQAGRRIIAESADLLMMEEGPASPLGSAAPHMAGPRPAPAAAAAAAPVANGLRRPPDQPLQPSGRLNSLDTAAALDARLSGRGRAGGETQLGFGQAQEGSAAAAGKKRAVPEPAGPSGAALQLMPPPPPRAPSGRAADGKRARLEPTPAAAPVAAAVGGGRAAAAQQAGAAGAGALAVVPAPGALLLRPPEPPVELTVALSRPPSMFDDVAGAMSGAAAVAGAGPSRELRVLNRERGMGGRPQADLQCTEGSSVRWSDSVRGLAVAACGTANFAAVGLADGQVVLYSQAGRRLAAPIKLGAGITRLACDDAWRLLALTTSGSLRLLDVESMRSLLTASLAPLLEGGLHVLDARLSRTGLPLVTLSNASAYAWSRELESWLCVADDSCAASQFAPMLRLGNQGELSSLQAEALRAAQPQGGAGAAYLPTSPAQQRQLSRAHLEANLAGALALSSPQEYRRWLVQYVRFLTEQGDQGRLSEVCDDLLGTLHMPSTAQPAAAGQQGGVPSESSSSSAPPGAWQPSVLGLDKRQLLRSDILREVARNRQLSGLYSKYKDALEEITAAQQHAAAQAAAQAAHAAAAGQGQLAAIDAGEAPGMPLLALLPA